MLKNDSGFCISSAKQKFPLLLIIRAPSTDLLTSSPIFNLNHHDHHLKMDKPDITVNIKTYCVSKAF